MATGGRWRALAAAGLIAVGGWANPLGLAALAVEAALVPLAVTRLRASPA